MAKPYDVIITGSGPNGLAAAIRLQQKGLSTAVFEQAAIPGGATRTAELTLPGFKHDVGSAIHPLTIDSPFFKTLPLDEHGLEWVFPEVEFAHPFLDGTAYAAYKDVEQTAAQLGADKGAYKALFGQLSTIWEDISLDLLGPFSIPRHPLKFASFGLRAGLSAKTLANIYFQQEKTKAFFYGAAAHSTLPLTNLASAAFGLVLFTTAHKVGWPFPKGGASQIHKSLISYYQALGGKLYLNSAVTNMHALPKAKAYVFDVTPKQLLGIEGTSLPWLYRKRLENYRYGAGIFKIDWALHNPIPFTNEACRKAGTIHIGYSTSEIERSERVIYQHGIVKEPYVLLAQHSPFDPSRAPAGKHTAWAYCHLPNNSDMDMTQEIENQIEKVAPGFKDSIITKATHTTSQMESFDPNLVGGDINGGKQDIWQLLTRPVISLSPYTTPNPQVYLCSASTPPGGGVHGMGGYHAAEKVLRDHFPDLQKSNHN
jgi:phytoene dehydrogenase-like protein